MTPAQAAVALKHKRGQPMPSPDQIEESVKILRRLLSRTNPDAPAHNELVDALRLLDDDLKEWPTCRVPTLWQVPQ
jgi:hypothetical protein